MKPDTYITEHLSVEDCQRPILADVAWLKQLYKHLTDKDKAQGLHNALAEIESMIYKSVETPGA